METLLFFLHRMLELILQVTLVKLHEMDKHMSLAHAEHQLELTMLLKKMETQETMVLVT
jgi:hypothetical protein